MFLEFTAGGYDFYRDGEGYWQAVHTGEPAPARGAYGRAETLAGLKNVPRHLVPEWTRRADDAAALSRLAAKKKVND